ncbi:transglutaminase-like domain-containing protein [Ruficoccus sp. ZRK36]|uniref:transglutaminase-like domain-containing protein n=1 Tax=Ruficoccus sp. ZRK36 TaxID=2866311 RepID=UPI001C733FAC|nr:transglutaminase-like domain-containing protein [Ruficoccus sp. ZRK36]QYY36114.1 transglutaminase-like domain-containing protein [Ruficoccus sp. ZRK36]
MKALLAVCLLVLLPPVAQAGLPFDPQDPPEGLFSEEWMEVYLLGNKVGYSRLSLTRDGSHVMTETKTYMEIRRGAVPMVFETLEKTTETLAGEPEAFSVEVAMAGQPIVQSGEIQDGTLTLTLSQQGRGQRRELPYPAGALMTWGLMLRTLDTPLEAGQSFSAKMYSPSLTTDAAVDVDYRVIGQEELALGQRTVTAWKAQMDIQLGATDFSTTIWTDEDYRVLKTSASIMGMPMEMISCDEETALTGFAPAEIFESNLVQLNKAIPADATEVVYHVSVDGADPDLSLPQGDYQKVERLGVGQFNVTVTRADHEGLARKMEKLGPNAFAEYRSSNLILDSDDEKVIELAKRAAPQDADADPVALADRLRVFVSDYIEDKNLTVGFATASEVARDPQGDCSEHAVLLAALGRVWQLPTRVVAGLVYLPRMVDVDGKARENVMGYHMWTQFRLDGQWVDFDAAMRESECAPTRLALMTSSLQETSISEIGLELLELIGQINVEIVSEK